MPVQAERSKIMGEKIKIYGMSGWPYTEKAREVFGGKVEYYDVKKNVTRLDEMLSYSKGKRDVPVIVEGEKVTVGYGGTWGVWKPGGQLGRRYA